MWKNSVINWWTCWTQIPTNKAHDCSTRKALNLMCAYKGTFAMANTSQNLGVMPCVYSVDKPMCCLTSRAKMGNCKESSSNHLWLNPLKHCPLLKQGCPFWGPLVSFLPRRISATWLAESLWFCKESRYTGWTPQCAQRLHLSCNSRPESEPSAGRSGCPWFGKVLHSLGGNSMHMRCIMAALCAALRATDPMKLKEALDR